MLSHVQHFVDPRTVACQAPLSLGFSRQKYWRGSYFVLQEIFLTQGANPRLLQNRWVFLTTVTT